MAKQEILKKAEDRVWLVKSSDTIIGPFTTAELAQNVRTKNVGLLDEARTPNNRWLFVRDIPEIQSTISKLAQQEDTFENRADAVDDLQPESLGVKPRQLLNVFGEYRDMTDARHGFLL